METKTKRTPRLPRVWEALLTFLVLIVIMAVGIIVFKVNPHMPMFVGVVGAAIMALLLGYDWETIETSMKDGIYRALQSIMVPIVPQEVPVASEVIEQIRSAAMRNIPGDKIFNP